MPLPHRPSDVLQQTLYSLLFKRLPGVLVGLLIGFGLAMVVNAAEDTTACGFGLLACDEQGVVWDFGVIGADNVAQLTGNDGLAEAILAFGYFLNLQVLPLLIAVALFIFLYYLARTFIIDAAYTDKREEARSRAIWGFVALIIIVSLWGIVNLLVGGLEIDDERSFCPDYLGAWCGNLGDTGAGSNLNFGAPNNFDTTPDSGFGAVGGTQGGSNTPAGSGTAGSSRDDGSALGELLFGRYTDTASFNFRQGAPRATSSVVTLSARTSCEAGVAALQTSADIEQLQGAYALYTNTSGETTWQNLTDGSSETSIAYDADTLLTLTQTTDASAIALIHTHPHNSITRLRLPMTGYGPSASDMELMCDDVVNEATFAIVDRSGVWSLTATNTLCPRRTSDRDALPIVSILTQLAVMESGDRARTLTDMITWDELPQGVRADMQTYASYDFDNLTAAEIIELADDRARAGGFRLTRQDAAAFCSSL